MQWLCSAAWLVACSLLFASSAQAFSDPFAYSDAPELGGGGGRWFTGSRADGYACDSCHTGGEPVDLLVEGLPLDGYIPGGAYEIIVRWPVVIENLTLVAEITNDQNLAAGSIRVPRLDALQPPERCGIELGGYPASEVFDTEDGRQMVSVIDCGATATRFLWTSPMTPDKDIWFNLGFVAADGEGDAAGDGVTLIAQPLPPERGGGGGSTTIVQGCAVTRVGRTAPATVAWALLGLALRRRFRRSVTFPDTP